MAQIREAAGELMPRVVSERRSGWGRTRVDSLGRVTVTPLADDPHTMPDVRGMGLKEAVFLLETATAGRFHRQGGRARTDVAARRKESAGANRNIEIEINVSTI